MTIGAPLGVPIAVPLYVWYSGTAMRELGPRCTPAYVYT